MKEKETDIAAIIPTPHRYRLGIPSAFRLHRGSGISWAVLYSVAYAIGMLIISGATKTQLYSPSPYHRLQADAFLSGHLYLANSIYQVGHDLAWHDGQVNQIWGLGVALWLTPFECLWRLCGQKWFPDRVALAVAFALIAFYTASTTLKWFKWCKSPTLGIGWLWLVTLCPAFWMLVRGPRMVYEETSLYACLVSFGILNSVVRFACFGERKDYVICASLAAIAALVRATHGIYGLAGIIVCSVILLARRPGIRLVLIGTGLFCGGLVALAITNWSRFGSPLEFGHSLTATPGMIVYMTRIENPMRQASPVAAGKELFGFLFLGGDISKKHESGGNLVPGQTSYPRWRDFYMTTFDVGWAAVCLVGAIGGALWIFKKQRFRPSLRGLLCSPTGALTAGAFLWSCICSAGLGCFYLYFPNLSSRYLLDFAPAFSGFALLVWLGCSSKWPWLSLLTLATWFGYEVFTSQVRWPPNALLSRAEITSTLPVADGRKLQTSWFQHHTPAA